MIGRVAGPVPELVTGQALSIMLEVRFKHVTPSNKYLLKKISFSAFTLQLDEPENLKIGSGTDRLDSESGELTDVTVHL